MTITLKSGRKLYANHGIIGLTPADQLIDGSRLSEGYDSPIFTCDYKDDEYINWSKDDLLEICNIMILRWLEFQNDIQMDRYPVDPYKV